MSQSPPTRFHDGNSPGPSFEIREVEHPAISQWMKEKARTSSTAETIDFRIICVEASGKKLEKIH